MLSNKIILIVGSILLIILGIIISNLYYINQPIKVLEKCNTQARVSGLWLPNLTELSNYNGHWICINIDETKTLNELENTCEHEIGHEIFARECETNFTKCEEVVG